MLEVTQWGSLLLYATQRGGIHAWDLRADNNAWSIPCSPNQVLALPHMSLYLAWDCAEHNGAPHTDRG